MQGKMKAVRIIDQPPGQMAKLELQEMDIPSYGDNEVLVKVRGAAICGSDKHFYDGNLKMLKMPLTLGHEFSGEIAAAGKNVKNTKVGDRVVSELQIEPCGMCKVCHDGKTHLCRHKHCPGLDMEGAYAEYIAMPASQIHVLPDLVSLKAAAVTEPAAVVATGLLERCGVKPEEFVVVFGAGPLGLAALQMCKAVGASKVVMVEGYNAERANMARKLGADLVIDDPKQDVPKTIMEMTNGFGADLCVDCAGVEASLNDAIHCLHKDGRISYIGVPGGYLSADFNTVAMNALSIISTYASSSSAWDKVISMTARGALDLGSLVTHQFPLEEFEEAFRVLVDNEAIKVIFTPHGPLE